MPATPNLKGLLIHKLTDKLIDNTKFIRTVGNVSVFINEKGIYDRIINYNFDPIQPKKLTDEQAKMVHPDWIIGTFDIEIYKIYKDLSKVYAAGFYTKNSMNTFYIDKDLDSDKLIMRCLNAMLKSKYNKYTFYIHNLSGFEIGFLLKVIIEAKNKDKNYDYNIFTKEAPLAWPAVPASPEKIISLTISYKINKKKYTIKFVDSYSLLSSKLEKLCKTFETEAKKVSFLMILAIKNTFI